MTIQLTEELERSIQAQVDRGLFASMDDAMAEAARLLLRELKQGAQVREKCDETDSDPVPKRKPFWERADEFRQSIPEEEWSTVPTDGAKQLDHYLYGSPKRPEA
ncbi:MAG: hypothetical protein NVSMB14_11350 [Isosphaeraceae bacterium]